MDIRELNFRDLNQVLELFEYLNPDDPILESDSIEHVWETTVSSGLITYYGVLVENKLISTCQAVVVPNFTRNGRPYCVIENVITNLNYRNQGYGKQVLRYAIQQAWDKNCYKVMLMSGRKEEAVMRFYKSAGFNVDEKQAFIARPNST